MDGESNIYHINLVKYIKVVVIKVVVRTCLPGLLSALAQPGAREAKNSGSFLFLVNLKKREKQL